MFSSNNDFDVDIEDFFASENQNNPIPSNLITSTQLSQSNSVEPTSVFTSQNSSIKNIFSQSFNDDEIFVDDDLILDKKENKLENSNRNKRPFTDLINIENKKQCTEQVLKSKVSSNAIDDLKKTNPFELDVQKVISKNDDVQCNFISNYSLNHNLIKELHLDKTSENLIPKSVIQKRKFPGPAGILPEINRIQDANNISASDLEESTTVHIKSTNLVTVCSQNTESKFNSGPWKKMLEDYNLLVDNSSSLPNKYTIFWLKSAANSKRLVQQKTPFLAAIVESLGSNFNIKLKDKTGDIDAVIDKEAWDEFTDTLIVGSVIVLRHVGVLTFSVRKHYLNITSNNVVAIYLNEHDTSVKIIRTNHYLNNTEFIKFINDTYSSVNKTVVVQKTNLPSSSAQKLVSLNNCQQKDYVNIGSFNSVRSSVTPELSNFVNKPTATKSDEVHTAVNSLNSNNKNRFNFKNMLDSYKFTPKDENGSASNETISSISNPNDKSTKLHVLDSKPVLDGPNIDTIINSTLDGLDADSLFGDF